MIRSHCVCVYMMQTRKINVGLTNIVFLLTFRLLYFKFPNKFRNGKVPYNGIVYNDLSTEFGCTLDLRLMIAPTTISTCCLFLYLTNFTYVITVSVVLHNDE